MKINSLNKLKNMKHTAKFFIKGLLVIALFTTGSIALSSAGVKTVSEAKAAISQQQAVQYLSGKGYIVISIASDKTSADWIAHTTLNGRDYTTRLHVVGSQIVGTEDVPFY